MKKTLLLSTLLLSTFAFANDYKYEISPLVGINSAEGNLGFKNNSYITGALEFQMNTPQSKISPEISLLYAPNVDYSQAGSTDVMRLMANGVYSFNKLNTITPFIKAGVGMEFLTTNKAGNEDRPFIDAGLGLKANITEQLALKLEALYLLKHGFAHAGSADSNLVTLLGFNYTFGAKTHKKVYHKFYKQTRVRSEEKTVQKRVIPPVEVIPVISNETEVIEQNQFKKLKENQAIDLHIKFQYKSTKVSSSSLETIAKYALFLKKHPNQHAQIIGYSDSIGSAKYNKKLSKKRADAVVKLLIEDGVESSQLIAIGRGEENPVANNATEAGRAQNRRIETKLIK